MRGTDGVEESKSQGKTLCTDNSQITKPQHDESLNEEQDNYIQENSQTDDLQVDEDDKDNIEVVGKDKEGEDQDQNQLHLNENLNSQEENKEIDKLPNDKDQSNTQTTKSNFADNKV